MAEPRVIPMLSYEDGAAAIEWLTKAFGFRERLARAKEAGATILSEPADQSSGDRHYRAEDLEGHRWMFSQRIHEVAPEEWGAVEA